MLPWTGRTPRVSSSTTVALAPVVGRPTKVMCPWGNGLKQAVLDVVATKARSSPPPGPPRVHRDRVPELLEPTVV